MCGAFVAQPKLDKILEEMGEHLQVDHHIVPVFGSVAWRFEKGPWSKQGVEGRVEATQRICEEHGFKGVEGRVWRDDQPACSWSAGMAVKAVFALEREGKVEAGMGAEYLRQLRRRFFVEDRNVARRSEQLALAESLKIAREAIEQRLDDGRALAALWEDHQQKEKLRIQGSPTYVFDNGRAMLYGNFDYAILKATVEAMVQGMGPGASAC